MTVAALNVLLVVTLVMPTKLSSVTKMVGIITWLNVYSLIDELHPLLYIYIYI